MNATDLEEITRLMNDVECLLRAPEGRYLVIQVRDEYDSELDAEISTRDGEVTVEFF